MHIDGTLINTLFDKEVVDLLALVALKLDDLAELCVIYDVAVTCKFLNREDRVGKMGRSGEHQSAATCLLESFQYLLEIILCETQT